MMSQKNFGLSPAAIDLGLGDNLKQQLEDEQEERRKKLLGTGKYGLPNVFGDNALAPSAASAALFGGLAGGK